MVPVPAVVMSTVGVLMNDDIVTIADNNLCGHRDGARKHSSNSRAQNDHSHISLLCFPRGQETLEGCNCFVETFFMKLSDVLCVTGRRRLRRIRSVHVLTQRIEETILWHRRRDQRALAEVAAHHHQCLQVGNAIDTFCDR